MQEETNHRLQEPNKALYLTTILQRSTVADEFHCYSHPPF